MSNSEDSTSSEDAYRTRRTLNKVAVAKKSTSSHSYTQAQPMNNYTTRRQAALAKETLTKKLEAERFLGNFNPETSIRERKKLSRKINPPSNVRRPPGALYDEHGVHIETGIDLCDCLNEDCEGCFFECIKCSSMKCGIDCRVFRRFMYDQIEYHGYDNIIKNPLLK